MAGLSLNIGLKSLLAAQAALDTIGHNVANVNTPGYSRQSLHLSAAPSISMRGLDFGSGVHADTIQRTVDLLLGKRMASQISSLGRIDGSLSGMSEVETLLGEPGGFGISSHLQSFFASVSELASNAGDPVLRNGMVQASTNLTSQFNQLADNLDVLGQDTFTQVKTNVNQVNELSKRIVKLNQDISSAQAAGMSPNDLRDQRDVAVQEMAQLLNISVHEEQNGSVRIMVAGQLLVGGTTVHQLTADRTAENRITLTIEGNVGPAKVTGGQIGGLMQFSQGFVPELQEKLDSLAANLIFQVNKVHSTGVPKSGPFEVLTGTYAIEDQDGDGSLTDELLNGAGLPFEVGSGVLQVNVTHAGTGQVTSHQVEVDANKTTVGGLIAALDQIPNLSAGLDGAGRLQILAGGDYRFDFSKGLHSEPDAVGSFGGGQASIGTPADGPYALSSGDTLDLVGPLLTPFSVTFNSADFADISQASAQEVAGVINANADIQANGMRAVVVGEQLVLQTIGTGSTTSFDITGGSALAGLGLTPSTVSGHDTAVDVAVSGTYTGAGNDELTFVPSMDGVIGTTAGLQVMVYDSNGTLRQTLNVGDGYLPGTQLELGDGLRVSFGLGELSATNNDSFVLPTIQDSDSADVLVALGLNSFLTGRDASDIGVRQAIIDDPNLIASSATGAEGDNTILLDMINLEGIDVAGLGNISLTEYIGDIVSGVGFEIESAQNARSVDQFLMDSLLTRREQISGVNLDEELVNMIEFEQAFAAATRYIQVVNDINDELLALV